MRKKLAIGFALVLLVLVGTLFVAWLMPSAEPPLRVGMTQAEVEQVIGKPDIMFFILNDHPEIPVTDAIDYHRRLGDPSFRFDSRVHHHRTEVDWLGDSTVVYVHYDENSLVRLVEVEHKARTRPPWLATAMKWVGW